MEDRYTFQYDANLDLTDTSTVEHETDTDTEVLYLQFRIDYERLGPWHDPDADPALIACHHVITVGPCTATNDDGTERDLMPGMALAEVMSRWPSIEEDMTDAMVAEAERRAEGYYS
jgi:hypothetical protein